eukprot:13292450-Ditylum_brightwellii.AAC.1
MTPNQQGIVPDPASSAVNKQANRTPRRYVPRTSKFEGQPLELKGHIYNAGYALQANLFVTTTRELANYAGRACNDSGYIHKAILEQKDVKFELPTLDDEFKKEDTKEIADILIQKNMTST